MKMDIGSGFDKKKAENLILSRYVHAEVRSKRKLIFNSISYFPLQ